jgi:(1->4)-alpha-D-glucan 1-alpha-D-glucosylmutase
MTAPAEGSATEPSGPGEPRATYRLQLHAGFGFEAAAALADYLAGLGVSHLYSSPCLQATPGSIHGYDVVDPGRVNGELGGEAGYERLVDTLRHHGLGLVLDIVLDGTRSSGAGGGFRGARSTAAA